MRLDEAERMIEAGRAKGCTGKTVYVGPRAAKRAQRRMARQVGWARTMKPYPCPHCGHWHLGHPSPAPVKARIREAWTIVNRYRGGRP